MFTLYCLDCQNMIETDNEDDLVFCICEGCGENMVDFAAEQPHQEPHEETGYYTCTHEDYPCCGC